MAALGHYRQRLWGCKYTGATGLTYEEAVTSEYRVGQVVNQVSAARCSKGRWGQGPLARTPPACVMLLAPPRPHPPPCLVHFYHFALTCM